MPYHIPKDDWLQALEGTHVLVASVVQACNECEGCPTISLGL